MREFEEVYKAYFQDVYLYIRSLSKDNQVAEDITSETFIKAIKNIDKFNGTCDIRVWLCQIAKNSYFSYLKKNHKLTYVEQFQEEKSKINIEKDLLSIESSMEIHEIIHNLGEPYKEVFSLRTFGELTFKQIAILFQKNENWACVTYHRAKKKIRDKLEEKNEN